MCTVFVTWDKDLIPSKLADPALYPGVQEPVRLKPVTDDDRLVYFAKHTNASLGQVKNLYLDWARVSGAMSTECQELNRLFSQCVDGNRIKIPERLKNIPSLRPDTPIFVLDDLHEHARQAVQRSSSVHGHSDRDWQGHELDVVELLSARDDIAMSEFELIQLAFRWCRANNVPLESLLHHFNMNVLNDAEKYWVLQQIPASMDTPNIVLNALCSSELLHINDLRPFRLEQENIRWKCVYSSSTDRLATFLSAASRNIEMFHRKLIVFRPDDRLTLAVYVPRKLERARDGLVDDSVRLFAFPYSCESNGQSRLALPTKMTYRLYHDENMFQLFQNQRSNSWIFLAHPGSDDSGYRNIKDAGDRRRQRQSTIDRGENFDIRASIALDKFNRNLQRYIGRINRAEVSAAVSILCTQVSAITLMQARRFTS